MTKNNQIKDDLTRCIALCMQRYERNTSVQSLYGPAGDLAVTLTQALTVAPAAHVRGWILHRLRSSLKPNAREVKPLNREELAVQLADVKRIKGLGRKHKFSQAKLDPFRAEILELNNQAASLSEIRDWLRRYRRVSVDKSTVFRSIRRWSDGEASVCQRTGTSNHSQVRFERDEQT